MLMSSFGKENFKIVIETLVHSNKNLILYKKKKEKKKKIVCVCFCSQSRFFSVLLETIVAGVCAFVTETGDALNGK